MSDLLQQIKALPTVTLKESDEAHWTGSRDVEYVRREHVEKILEGMAVVPYGLLLDVSDHVSCCCGTELEDLDGEVEVVGKDECTACCLDALIGSIANPVPQPTLAPDGDGGVE